MAAFVVATLLVPLLRNVAPGKAPPATRIEPVSNDVHAGGGRRRQSVDIFAATCPKPVAESLSGSHAAWNLYPPVVNIEQAFKNLKHDLALRPIFHHRALASPSGPAVPRSVAAAAKSSARMSAVRSAPKASSNSL